jgi:N-acetylmuramoyl-L-alanine amidase
MNKEKSAHERKNIAVNVDVHKRVMAFARIHNLKLSSATSILFETGFDALRNAKPLYQQKRV